jgi:phage shock protein E
MSSRPGIVRPIKEDCVRRRGRTVARWATALVGLAWIVSAPAGCGGGGSTSTATIETISPAEAAGLVSEAPEGLVVLDVRTPAEFAGGHLAGAVNLDYQAAGFADRLAELDRAVPYVLYCRTGNRSAQVREMMRDLGFAEVHEIAGGIVAWAEAGLGIVLP